MSKPTRIITRTLSFRLSLRIIVALAALLLMALLIIYFFSRKAVKDEALQNAQQTLEAAVLNIDNILFDVEQAVGNIYWKIALQIDHKAVAEKYARKILELNPYVADCRIDWAGDSITSETHWGWTDPMRKNDGKGEAVTSFCLPLYDKQQRVAVLTVDVSLALLSKIVLETKPSPNSYCTLLGRNGSYIVHPDSAKLNHNVFDLAMKDGHPSVVEAAEAMVAGETGYKRIVMRGQHCFVFYKPFERADEPGRTGDKLGWSVGIIYPEDDILGNYRRLLYTVLAIALAGMILLLLLCRGFIHRQLLPLRQLAKSAQRIAEGHYDEPIPISLQQDEVGRLQNHFHEMQQSLATRMGEMQQLTDSLQERGEVLQAAYEQAQVADNMKMNFLYNMSNEMIAPVSGICKNVKIIYDRWNSLSDEEASRLVGDIQLWSGKVTDQLNQLIRNSEKLNIEK